MSVLTFKRKRGATAIESRLRGLSCRFDGGGWLLFFAPPLAANGGKRRALSLKTADPKLAEKILTQVEEEFAEGRRFHELTLVTAAPTAVPTVAQAAEEFMRDLPRLKEPQTCAGYTGHLRRWLRSSPVAAKPVTLVLARDLVPILHRVRDTKNQYGRFNSRGTAEAVLTAFYAVFSWCVKRGYLVDRDGRPLPNPCKGLKAECAHAERDAVAPRVRVFSRAEQARLLAAARELGHWLATLILLGLRAGLRIGEILALEVEDIELRRGFIQVTKRLTRQGIRPGTKNKRGGERQTRLVQLDLSDDLPPALRALLAEREAENKKKGWTTPLLFPHTRGTGPRDYRNFIEDYWWPLVERVGLQDRDFHDTRHTFASELLESPTVNGNIDFVARQLGDTVSVTEKTYRHVIERLQPRFAGALNGPKMSGHRPVLRRVRSRRPAAGRGTAGPLGRASVPATPSPSPPSRSSRAAP